MIGEHHCYVLVCDVCGEASDCVGAMADQHFGNSEAARSEARLFYGWTGDGVRDVCPTCAPVPYLPVGDSQAREVGHV